MGAELRDKILSLMDEHPGIKSPELKDAYTERLRLAFLAMSTRPTDMPRKTSPISEREINKHETTFYKWQARLIKLQELLRSGQTTGDALTDFVLVRYDSLSKALAVEKYLRELQAKIVKAVGQEILVVEKQTGRITRGQCYDYNTHKLTLITDPNLKVDLGKPGQTRIGLLSSIDARVDLPVEGYAYVSDDRFNARGRIRFYQENLNLPEPDKQEDFFAVGTEEISLYLREHISKVTEYKILKDMLISNPLPAQVN